MLINKKMTDFKTALAKGMPELGNSVALGLFDISKIVTVERDEAGIPIAWQIFKMGRNEVTKHSGERFSLNFTSEMFDTIIANFAEKGSVIPLDSRHFLRHLAIELKVDEMDIVKMLPDGKGTFGFGKLEKRPDGLWVVGVEYVPLARDLMAQKIFRYFSPVIHGLADGQLRVTSVAFLNEPALNNLDSIAAGAEDRDFANFAELTTKIDALTLAASSGENSHNISTNTQNKESSMNKTLMAIAGLVAMDSIALGADGEAPEGVVTKLNNLKEELTDLRAGKEATDGFLGKVRESLALGADADLNAAQGAIVGIVEKAGNADKLKLRVDTLELGAETDKKAKLIEQGKASGKLSANMVEKWAGKQDSVALSAFLEHAPVVVPIKQVAIGADLQDPNSISLSAEDKAVAKNLNITEAEMLASKKGEPAPEAK